MSFGGQTPDSFGQSFMKVVVPGPRFHVVQEVLASMCAKMQLGMNLPELQPALAEDRRASRW